MLYECVRNICRQKGMLGHVVRGALWGGGGTLENNYTTLNETPDARSQQFL